MSELTVFISHQMTPQERVLAWRLQTLGASYGFTVFVPTRDRRKISDEVKSQIDHSDAVIALILHEPIQAVREEIQYALSKKIPIIPIVPKGVKIKDVPRHFVFDPNKPSDEVGNQIFEHLRSQKQRKDKAKKIGQLAVLGISLLALYLGTRK